MTFCEQCPVLKVIEQTSGSERSLQLAGGAPRQMSFLCTIVYPSVPPSVAVYVPTSLIRTGQYRDINRIRPNILEMSAHFRRKCLLG